MVVFFRRAVSLAVFSVLLPAALSAHGVEVTRLEGEAAGAVETLRFMYSTGEPLMYARISVFAPSGSDVEVLQSRTDRNGVFSFVPDEAGPWRVVAEDGMGHLGEARFTAGEGALVSAPSGGRLPLLAAAVLGVSLILNIFALWYFARARRKEKNYAH
jgi:nickel transport protein